jgi:hypothetical protein
MIKPWNAYELRKSGLDHDGGLAAHQLTDGVHGDASGCLIYDRGSRHLA